MIAISQMDQEITDRLSPLEKLISSQKLTFIPNLYYQQYRLLDSLQDHRLDYPEQKILIPKQPSRHDHFIREMQKKQFIQMEDLKYRKAVCFNLAKCAKEEFFKKKLKKQEKYLFHRVAFSQLAESVKQKFQYNKKDESNGQEMQQIVKDEKKNIKKRQTDNIFLDKSESDDNMEQDLIGDMFDNQKVEKISNPASSTVQDFIKKIQNMQGHGKECKKSINRKICLKKINENIRKRIKSKLNQDSGQKNLNSATVLITSLISGQIEAKHTDTMAENNLIETPAENEFLNSVQPRHKKKKEDNFELKWNREQMDIFNERNSKFQIGKSKFDSNYLALCISKDDKQYQKLFNKNLTSKDQFPPSLSSIPSLDSKFKLNCFMNTNSDREYELAIIRHNKRQKFQKFKKISKLALSEPYSYDNESLNNNIAKIFLSPDHIMSERVIYQVNNNKIVSVNAIHNKSNLSKEELLLLNFLVRRYLCIFGSNWEIITTLILTHPNFSSMYLTTVQIQQLYQIPKEKDQSAFNTSIQQISLLKKKILPSSVFINCSYQPMRADMSMVSLKMDENQQNQTMVDESYEKNGEDIDLNLYQSIIQEELEDHDSPKDYAFCKTAKLYDSFTKNMKLPYLKEQTSSLLNSLSNIITEFEGKFQVKTLESKQPTKMSQCSDWVLEKVKNQIKFNTPIRKRKNITDKSSELVKILHTLKQRIQNPPRAALGGVGAGGSRAPLPDTPRDVKTGTMTSSAPPPPIAVTTVPTPTPPETPTIKKTLPKPKPEDKKDKAAPKEQKERKKKAGKDDKQADKEQDSK